MALVAYNYASIALLITYTPERVMFPAYTHPRFSFTDFIIFLQNCEIGHFCIFQSMSIIDFES